MKIINLEKLKLFIFIKNSELESMISNEVIEKLDDIDQKLSYSLKNKYKTEEKKDV
ncbi:hypothetical protein EfmJHP36_05180 [Enterococcus faecium]|nr:hypothetical protein EfmJHP36_05180 [Enterococcus faecium]